MNQKHIDDLFERHHANDGGFCRHYLTLYALALGLEAKSVLELGHGFSTKAILFALEQTGGHLTTIDIQSQSENDNKMEDDFDAQFLVKHWTFINGDSIGALNKMKGNKYDLVLHDGSHTEDVVRKDLDRIIPMMKTHGLILLHDTKHPTRNYGLNRIVKEIDLPKVTLPYGCGLTIFSVNKNLGNGKVETAWRKTPSI